MVSGRISVMISVVSWRHPLNYCRVPGMPLCMVCFKKHWQAEMAGESNWDDTDVRVGGLLHVAAHTAHQMTPVSIPHKEASLEVQCSPHSGDLVHGESFIHPPTPAECPTTPWISISAATGRTPLKTMYGLSFLSSAIAARMTLSWPVVQMEIVLFPVLELFFLTSPATKGSHPCCQCVLGGSFSPCKVSASWWRNWPLEVWGLSAVSGWLWSSVALIGVTLDELLQPPSAG